MADILHNVNDFKFINRTRYSSEDIAALVTMIHRVAAGAHMVFEPDQHRHKVDVYEFHDYNPSQYSHDVREWDNTKNMTVIRKVPNFVKPPGWALSTCWKIGFVVPEKLYANPVEALAASSQETPVVPAGFSRQFVQALIGSMRPSNFAKWEDVQATKNAIYDEAETMQIRILPKRESPANSDERRKKEVRAKALQATMKLSGHLYDAKRHTHGVHGPFISFMESMKAANITPPITKEEVVRVIQALDDMVQRVSALQTELKKQAE